MLYFLKKPPAIQHILRREIAKAKNYFMININVVSTFAREISNVGVSHRNQIMSTFLTKIRIFCISLIVTMLLCIFS